MKKVIFLLMFLMLGNLSPSSAADSKGVNLKPKTSEEWQTYLKYRREETLENLFAIKPEAKTVIANAQGYAVFSNFGMKLGFVGGGNGRGVLHVNKTGKDTYMRMMQAGVGWGLGIKDFRVVFVFDNQEVMDQFLTSGWSFGGQANASAKTDTAGADMSGAIAVAPGVRVYQLTQNGLAVEAMVNGTKYWVDKAVNK
jgi:lipid-binding SYLF domain-containing protein